MAVDGAGKGATGGRATMARRTSAAGHGSGDSQRPGGGTAMQQISADWWIGLDDSYKTRVDDGSLVFWKPERTVWINIWKEGDGRPPRERLAVWKEDRHVAASDLFEESAPDVLRFAYLLEEPEDEGGHRLGVYSFTVSETSTVQMACYFDLREDLDWAVAVARSLSFRAPDPSLKVDEAVGKDGHLVLVSEKIIGPEREPVLLAFREPRANEQDSGWRFFHGDEDEQYTSDPYNIALCPLSSLLGIDPSLRAIINHPAGTAWGRDSAFEPWSPSARAEDDTPPWA